EDGCAVENGGAESFELVFVRGTAREMFDAAARGVANGQPMEELRHDGVEDAELAGRTHDASVDAQQVRRPHRAEDGARVTAREPELGGHRAIDVGPA